MFAGWTISGIDESTAKSSLDSDTNLGQLTKTVAETVGTTNRYFKNLNPTNGATITFTAKWKDALKAAVEVIEPASYGQKVIYNANGVSDWKIFLNDVDEEDKKQHVYLIAGDVVPNRVQKDINYIEKLDEYTVRAWDARSHLLNYLMDGTNWEEFAKGIESTFENPVSVTGGPTVEQWIESWNSKGYVKLSYAKTGQPMEDNKYGYQLKIGDILTHWGRLDGYSEHGCWDKLYYQGIKYAAGYWLVDGSSLDTKSVLAVMDPDYFGEQNFASVDFGVRPVIKLPSNLKMTWNTEKQAWEIAPEFLTGAITAQNYGDKVDYLVEVPTYNTDGTLIGTIGKVNDWKIFLQEDNSIYLISSDCLENRQLPNSDEIIKGATHGICGKNNALQIVNYMKGTNNSEIWRNFKNSYADLVTGGITWEQFWASYNAKYGTSYGINDEQYVDLVNHVGYNDTLYFNLGHSVRNNLAGYWLANTYSETSLKNCFIDGKVSTNDYNYGMCGIRPLVKLKSNTILSKWDGTQWILGTKIN